ncbi:hypothetical protein DL768_001760 [Monosporascus sp. mg162]|nr:hypothetical protein DL768_001760 [Monosporascus sp. mg162]
MQSVLRQTDYFFQQLIDDFNSEFHDRTNNKKNNGRSYNAQKGKGGNNNSRDNNPAWNKNGEPLCFNCGNFRNTRSNTCGGGPGKEQFIPKGLGNLYRSSGGTFSAHIDEQ